MHNDEIGPLQYVAGSHKWGKARAGTAAHFFQSERRDLLDSAARMEGIDPSTLDISTANVSVGGAGVHNGLTWHGSGPNRSSRLPRRGIGIHFVPANVRWKADDAVGPLWRRLKTPGSNEVSDALFPVTFDRRKHLVRAGTSVPSEVSEESAQRHLKDRHGIHLTVQGVRRVLSSARCTDSTRLALCAACIDLNEYGAPMLRPSPVTSHQVAQDDIAALQTY